jgi:bis(5'-nucleosyl)-tetraphosphatase (symmetrical)
MSTWVIGDIQGCMSSLEALLARIDFDPASDRLWQVGDLVNRGPRSLDVVRWARGLGEAFTCVLGNHDLHLLARAAGVAGPKKRDTLDEILAAPDRDLLIDWLRTRPLAHRDGERMMVHAGLHPRWTAKEAGKLAREISDALAADDWRDWMARLAQDKAPRWRDDLRGIERARAILAYLARARCLDARGDLVTDFDGHPKDAPDGARAWFEHPDASWRHHTIVFGHWAALGLTIGVRHLGVDSGCVWGSQLTAVCLDDRRVVQVDAVERRDNLRA